ncbi:hypothetical protein PF005_g25091 [Phytophthora fragariae]|uniref:Secreted protein n=2 Tax=Phytophthora TaxID=4783 RepID=A0A6A3W466_9STRA|nr:hypothetical protein PF003_g20410 [Phytophthora fragariae]KAE9032328.1 hypothetical protein PR002_g9232 [Phytophthora rubi]KAE8928480.1 hypothetical protein PF009_g21379 [Phytophthora fragariae]KAE8976736.1 hypothetical protein PF011_g23926 [Phytophthora fragariae]KAE9035969.1 hypothetical protein PR001_g9059 [Phytophthora rubi]
MWFCSVAICCRCCASRVTSSSVPSSCVLLRHPASSARFCCSAFFNIDITWPSYAFNLSTCPVKLSKFLFVDAFS